MHTLHNVHFEGSLFGFSSSVFMCCLNFSGLSTRSNHERGKSFALAIFISNSWPLSVAMTAIVPGLAADQIHLHTLVSLYVDLAYEPPNSTPTEKGKSTCDVECVGCFI